MYACYLISLSGDIVDSLGHGRKHRKTCFWFLISLDLETRESIIAWTFVPSKNVQLI